MYSVAVSLKYTKIPIFVGCVAVAVVIACLKDMSIPTGMYRKQWEDGSPKMAGKEALRAIFPF